METKKLILSVRGSSLDVRIRRLQTSDSDVCSINAGDEFTPPPPLAISFLFILRNTVLWRPKGSLLDHQSFLWPSLAYMSTNEAHCWFDVGPASGTLANIKSTLGKKKAHNLLFILMNYSGVFSINFI